MELAAGLLIPFLGTTLGAACVFFVKNEIHPLVQKALLGFASGVMVAASVWSLLIPSMEMTEGMGRLAFVPAAVGFLLGILFLLAMDRIIPHLHLNEEAPEGLPSHLKKTTMLVLAVTLHNIPEGMAVDCCQTMRALHLPLRWHCRSELPFRTFRRAQSFPFRSKARAAAGKMRSSTVWHPGQWNRWRRLLPYC